MTIAPILIIGTERSGSNLLRLVLNAHSNIAVPHPPHFMRYLSPIAASYGDLRREPSRRALTRAALTLLDAHIHPWPHLIDEDQVVATASPTLFGIVAAIYDQYRIAEGKSRWGCKSTFMVDYVDEVLAQCRAARFVWLVRDPRDVAASAKRSVFGPCHPYLTGALWRRQQERADAALTRYGPKTVYLLRYEDLVSRPEAEIERLCAFIDEPFERDMLDYHRSSEAKRTAHLSRSWRNTDQPITTGSIELHRDTLSLAERLQVERVAGPMMMRLGYQAGDDTHCAIRPSLLELYVRDFAMRAVIEYRSLREDANHARRWRRDATVGWLRLRALTVGLMGAYT